MKAEHKQVFFNAADRFNCWIGLREPNKLADKWIGQPGFSPKGVDCKAKTADNEIHKFSGLVVNPFLCRDAFKPATLNEAKEKWRTKFLLNNKPPFGFACIETGPEMGLVKHLNKAIYADFDLMSLINADESGGMIFTDEFSQKKLFTEVKSFLNLRLGAPMIQHGPEMLYSGVGPWKQELVYFFGPKTNFKASTSHIYENNKNLH